MSRVAEHGGVGEAGRPREIERRIFVVAVPRSGTTLVQSLLAAHGELTSFTETHFFWRHFKLVPPRGAVLTADPEPRLAAFLLENEVAEPLATAIANGFREAIGGPRLPLPLRTARTARALLATLDRLAIERGASGWVEKTPRHLRFVPFLARLLPGSSVDFVHVIRDGNAVVPSLVAASRHWERAYDADECVRRWNDDVRFSLGRAGSPRDHFVFYEDLTAEPEREIERLFHDLGLDPQPVLERHASQAGRWITPGETWKEGVGRTVRPSPGRAAELDTAARKRVSRTLHSDLYDELRAACGRAPRDGAGQ